MGVSSVRSIERALREIERLSMGGWSTLDAYAERTVEPEEREEGRAGWSFLAGEIERAYRSGGFVSAVIYGRQGSGKSVYAIKVAWDVLNRLGMIPRSAGMREVWKRYMVFSAESFIRKLRAVDFFSRYAVIIWDDAGVHGSAYTHFIDPFLAKAIGDVFRVARTRTASILFTTPSPGDLLKPLRSYDSYIVYVHPLSGAKWMSRAHIYSLRLLPSGSVRIYKVAIEDFSRYMRSYDDYVKYRDKYADYALDELERLIKKRRERRVRERDVRDG